MTWTRNDALLAETQEANLLGVPVALAHAIAQVESGHDPYATGDYVGGVPTSFGDYQLHRGGELGSLTPAQAFNPWTNARVALGEVARVIRANPRVRDPGTIAALAQRPGDPRGYAVKVDQAMQTAPAGSSSRGVQTTSLAGFPGLGGGVGGALGGAAEWSWDKVHGWVLNPLGDIGKAIGAPFVAIYNLFRGVWDFFTSAKTWIRIGFFVGGMVIIVGGAKLAFSE